MREGHCHVFSLLSQRRLVIVVVSCSVINFPFWTYDQLFDAAPIEPLVMNTSREQETMGAIPWYKS